MEEKLDLQIKLLKKQNFWLRLRGIISLVICAILIAAGVYLYPIVNEAATQITEIAGQADTAIEDLEQIAEDLNNADISGLMENTQNLVDESTVTVETALQKIEEIDIETLNSAINGLNSVVTPLAKLFGK